MPAVGEISAANDQADPRFLSQNARDYIAWERSLAKVLSHGCKSLKSQGK
jgi:uncharacterized membrane protein YidH (DUF202 family)